jgi:hypothetical protein
VFAKRNLWASTFFLRLRQMSHLLSLGFRPRGRGRGFKGWLVDMVRWIIGSEARASRCDDGSSAGGIAFFVLNLGTKISRVILRKGRILDLSVSRALLPSCRKEGCVGRGCVGPMTRWIILRKPIYRTFNSATPTYEKWSCEIGASAYLFIPPAPSHFATPTPSRNHII